MKDIEQERHSTDDEENSAEARMEYLYEKADRDRDERKDREMEAMWAKHEAEP